MVQIVDIITGSLIHPSNNHLVPDNFSHQSPLPLPLPLPQHLCLLAPPAAVGVLLVPPPIVVDRVQIVALPPIVLEAPIIVGPPLLLWPPPVRSVCSILGVLSVLSILSSRSLCLLSSLLSLLSTTSKPAVDSGTIDRVDERSRSPLVEVINFKASSFDCIRRQDISCDL